MATLEIVHEGYARIFEFDASGKGGCMVGPVRLVVDGTGRPEPVCFPGWWEPDQDAARYATGGGPARWAEAVALTCAEAAPTRPLRRAQSMGPHDSLRVVAYVSRVYGPGELVGLDTERWGRLLSEEEGLVELRLNGSVLWGRRQAAMREAAAGLAGEIGAELGAGAL